MSLASQIRDTGNCFRQTPPTKKPKKRIPPMSKKRIKENKQYLGLRRMFLGGHPDCEAGLPGCTTRATDIHHMLGRGKFFLEESTWLALCRPCHTWCHSHPSEARRLGLLK